MATGFDSGTTRPGASPPGPPATNPPPVVVHVSRRWTLTGVASTLAIALLAAGGLLMAYRMLRTDLEASVYKRRLETVAQDYESLRARFNSAIARTAVTELIVDEGKLTVRIRDAEGLLKEIPTPFNPAGEIYVDYVLIDQRLWIRRVFDAATPPEKALVIDPSLAAIDWDAPGAAHGKAVYRRLSPGRWAITVSGGGSLVLERADPTTGALTRGPAIADHRESPEEAKAAAEAIGPRDVWQWITTPNR
ncbi:MAG: hypothetical protein SFZ23_06715 [Planctomycetota bacterium]|nr:hypothetical protein [Planctomycetota bacterium]